MSSTIETFDTMQIAEGTEVFGSDGEKLGKVASVQSDTMVVEKGFFFPTDYYIPMSAVASAEEGKAYLNVTKDEALNQTWGTAPTTGEWATTGTTTTVDTTVPVVAATETVGAETWPAAPVVAHGAMEADSGAAIEHRQDSTRTHQNTDDGLRIDLHEEELTATKTQRELGAVRIEKDVIAEERTLQVPVTEERVTVTRHAVDRGMAAGANAFEQDTIAVPVMGEEVQLQKQVRVAEEVEVGKEAVQRTEQVTGTVRREEVRVSGDVEATAGMDQPTGRVVGQAVGQEPVVEPAQGPKDRKRSR